MGALVLRSPCSGNAGVDRHCRPIFDRERAAARDLLPNSIIKREKSPYPSTQDPGYENAVRSDVAEIFEDATHPVAPLLNRKSVEELLLRPIGNTSSLVSRAGLERVRSLGAWVKEYGVAFEL